MLRRALLTAGICALISAAPAGATSVTVTDLGTLGGDQSSATAINDAGQVVGTSTTSENAQHAFLWTATDGMVDLGTLGGSNDYSDAIAVNGSGQVVGTSHTTTGEWHAYSWTDAGGIVDLGTLGGGHSYARDVNGSGQVVGLSGTSGGETHAFVGTEAGDMTDIGTLGDTFSEATAINDSGQVVGTAYTTQGGVYEVRAFSWTEAGGVVDLGSLGSSSAEALAVNDSGQVVGKSYTGEGEQHAFSWTQAGGMVDLGALGGGQSEASGVNGSGEVVGTSLTSDGKRHAFSWTEAGGMVDLGAVPAGDSSPSGLNDSGLIVGSSSVSRRKNPPAQALSWRRVGGLVMLGTLGGETSRARAVNATGQIVGSAMTADDHTHAALWTLGPTSSITSPGDGVTVKPGTTLEADFLCVDNGGSAIASCVGELDGSVAVETGDPLPTAEPGTHTLTVTATDELGRTGTATHSYVVDGAGPAISLAPADGTWVAKDASLVAGFACTDSAGVESCTATLDGEAAVSDGDTLPTGSEGSHTLLVEAEDGIGNTSSASVTYRVDDTDPAVTVDAFEDGDWVARDEERVVDFACTDSGGSGVASCTGLLDGTVVKPGDPLPTGSEESHTLVVTGVDEVGNDATASSTYHVDGTDPSASISSPADDAVVAKGATLNADFSCADDGGSGIRSCAGKLDGSPVSDGDALPTATDAFHTLVVQATDEVGHIATAESTYYAGEAPANGRPSISAAKWVDGQSVSADHGDWEKPVGEYHYEWLRCSFTTVASCQPIPGAADADTYTLSGDAGKWIRVRVAASNPAGESVAVSPVSPRVGVPVVSTQPSVSGTTRTGDTLIADTGEWDPPERSVQVRWLRCASTYLAHCTKITGTPDSDDLNATYTLVDADDAKRIRAQVVAKNAAGSSSPATSAATVLIDKPTLKARPKLLPSLLRTDDTIETDLGDWTGDPTLKVEWLRCTRTDLGACSKIASPDATDDNASYKLVDADDARHLIVRVTARNASGAAPYSLSLWTPKVDKPVLKTRPAVTGIATVGQTLSTDHGDWSGKPLPGYTVEWLRCTTIYLAGCTKITTGDATDDDSTYTPTDADAGARIRSRVQAHNASGDSTRATSRSTKKVTAAF